MDVIEPFLLQLGFIKRTARGRVATAAAYEHLNLPTPNRMITEQSSLFDPSSNKNKTGSK
jgi:hypothetical protein